MILSQYHLILFVSTLFLFCIIVPVINITYMKTFMNKEENKKNIGL